MARCFQALEKVVRQRPFRKLISKSCCLALPGLRHQKAEPRSGAGAGDCLSGKQTDFRFLGVFKKIIGVPDERPFDHFFFPVIYKLLYRIK
jgi:hypothetical protein